jgi:protein tyrosine/serine phosphatase
VKSSKNGVRNFRARAIIAAMRLVILFSLFVWAGLPARADERPANWAQPVKTEHLKNLHKISDQLYRCAQPDEAGMRELEKLGIRTVINLRDYNDDVDKARGTKLRLIRFEMNAWEVEEERVARVLALLRETEHGPFAIHCQHGADRTGVVSALYRLVEQGWTREDAVREMREGGYGFHKIWANIVRYVNRVDIDKVRKRVDELAPPKK